jgi:hypothetical protein
MTEQQTELSYWDIFPQSIRLSQSLFEQRIPLSIQDSKIGVSMVPRMESGMDCGHSEVETRTSLGKTSQYGCVGMIVSSGIRSSLAGTPIFESSNTDVAEVDESGNIICGMQPGAAIVVIWSSDARESVRHVQVEVSNPMP